MARPNLNLPHFSCATTKKVLAHELNVGYEGMKNLRLLSFNGERVKSLAHLVDLADGNTEPFLRFDFFQDKVVVLDAAGIPAATSQICRENSIPTPRSADLLPPEAAPVDASFEESQNNEEAGGTGTGVAKVDQPPPAINGAPQPSVSETVATVVDARNKRVAGRRPAGGGKGSGLRSAASAAIGRVKERILGSGTGSSWGTMRADRDDACFGGGRGRTRESMSSTSSRWRMRGHWHKIWRRHP